MGLYRISCKMFYVLSHNIKKTKKKQDKGNACESYINRAVQPLLSNFSTTLMHVFACKMVDVLLRSTEKKNSHELDFIAPHINGLIHSL